MSLSRFVQRPFDHFFDDVFDNSWPMTELAPKTLSKSGWTRSLGAMDVNENDSGWQLKIDAPGLGDSDIKVQAHPDNRLTISGERKSETEDKEKGYYERSYGKFSRSIRLGDNADTANISAKMVNGVLDVSVPKKTLPAPKVTNIPIQMINN